MPRIGKPILVAINDIKPPPISNNTPLRVLLEMVIPSEIGQPAPILTLPPMPITVSVHGEIVNGIGVTRWKAMKLAGATTVLIQCLVD